MTSFRNQFPTLLVLAFAVFVSPGCSNERSDLRYSEEVQESDNGESAGEAHDEEGEESGTEYALNETYDEVRLGTRLVLNYDESSNSFVGTVENISEQQVRNVRVEVHLSNGVELGPTARLDLMPSQKQEVRLQAENKDFDGFTAHAEVGGSGEEGEHSGEEGEHGGEEREHSEEGEEH